MNTYLDYISKYNLNHENQIIILIIPNGERWHYLAVEKLPALLKEIMSKHDGDFCCLNRLYIFRTKKRM